MERVSAAADAGASDPGPPPDDPVGGGNVAARGPGAVPVSRGTGAKRDAGEVGGVPSAAVEASLAASGAAPLATGQAAQAAQEAGLDPNTSFLLKIKLVCNRKKDRRRGKCFGFEKVVDSDLTNFSDLVESVVEEFPPGYLEVPHVQYYDEATKTFPEIKSDQELMAMFSKNSKTKVVIMFITYRGASDPYEPIFEWEFEVDDLPIEENEQDDYLKNPLPENEHVGVDEEGMYLQMAPHHEPVNALLVIPSSMEKEKDPAYAPSDSEEGDDSEHGDDSEDGDDSEHGDDSENGDEEEAAREVACIEENHAPNVEYDPLDPPMEVGSTYANMKVFKLAMSQHAIKHQFEFNTAKSGPNRFRAYCSRKKADKCPWWLYASTTADGCTVKVKKNPCAHDCSSTRRKKKVKNATKHWIAENVKDFLIADPTVRAKVLQQKLKEHHKVHINYKRVYMGKELAMRQLYGDWDSSFNNLYRFKAQVESCCPGSLVIIDHHTINGKIRFRRFFFALKPCIEGFLSGCRPYLAIDSTFLTGKYKGQLAAAVAVDGHNWLYPVCFGVFDSETNDNWIWFMSQLKEAIGSPRRLTICTDAGQAVMAGVSEVFPYAEHRECMFHLVNNFKKRYHGKVFDDHLWAAAYSWNSYVFDKHWAAMESAKPAATNYLRKSHQKLWTRSQFSTFSKVDYVTNNLAECFNNWIKQHKALNLDDFMDKLRQLLMTKWNQRRKISKKLDGIILPHIVKALNEKSRELNLEVEECSEEVAEVTAMGGSGFRFVVNLHERTCSCRKWQVSGIPCDHALAFITSLSHEPIEKYVDLYYSIEKFRVAYSQLIPAMPDKTQWPKSTHGFFMHPPLLKAVAGRPKTERFKGNNGKKRTGGQHQCPICLDYGHHWHNCKKGNPEDIAAMKAIRGTPKKRTKKAKEASSSIMPFDNDAPVTSMSFPPSQTIETIAETTTKKKRKHADSTPEASNSQSLEITSKKKGQPNNSNSGGSKRSQSGSNQPESTSNGKAKQIDEPVKGKAKKVMSKKKKKKELCQEPRKLILDSPSMCTRSKMQPASPAMSTRSKRRLSL